MPKQTTGDRMFDLLNTQPTQSFKKVSRYKTRPCLNKDMELNLLEIMQSM